MKKLNLVLAGLAISAVAGSALANVYVLDDGSCAKADVQLLTGEVNYKTLDGQSHSAQFGKGHGGLGAPTANSTTSTSLQKVQLMTEFKPGSIVPFTFDATKDANSNYTLKTEGNDVTYTLHCDASATDPSKVVTLNTPTEQ